MGLQILEAYARTPLGLTAQTSAAAVRAGISRIGDHPVWCDLAGEPIRMARDGVLSPELCGVDRVFELATAPLLAACDSCRARAPSVPIRVILGLPQLRPGWTAAHEQRYIQRIDQLTHPRGNVQLVYTKKRGHAATLAALDIAVRAIAQGGDELFVVGGADSYHEPKTLAWLQRNGQLKTLATRSGFLPGEGAGFVVAASTRLTAHFHRGDRVEVLGSASALEPKLIKTGADTVGEGLSRAIREAAASLRSPVHNIYCDINGERYRTDEWAFVSLRCHSVLDDPAGYVAPVDCWGDLGAATGTVGLSLAMQAWERGYARGPTALICAGSEDGLRCVTVLERTKGRD
ncbi:MAG: beta-ketoacyl synthase N-terminal-like domain-containing protein [Myxococcota bacterium]